MYLNSPWLHAGALNRPRAPLFQGSTGPSDHPRLPPLAPRPAGICRARHLAGAHTIAQAPALGRAAAAGGYARLRPPRLLGAYGRLFRYARPLHKRSPWAARPTWTTSSGAPRLAAPACCAGHRPRLGRPPGLCGNAAARFAAPRSVPPVRATGATGLVQQAHQQRAAVPAARLAAASVAPKGARAPRARVDTLQPRTARRSNQEQQARRAAPRAAASRRWASAWQLVGGPHAHLVTFSHTATPITTPRCAGPGAPSATRGRNLLPAACSVPPAACASCGAAPATVGLVCGRRGGLLCL